MKRIIVMISLLMAVTTMAFCVQPSKKNAKKEVTDSTAIILAKAKAGDAVAQNTVGVWYYTGKDSIKQDYKQALQWWARSAKQENVDAIGNMAMSYQLGRGTEKDSAMAVKLYQTAIKKGNKDIIPQHEKIVKNTKSVFSSLLLHDCYFKGVGVKKDLKQATAYQEIAAEGGHEQSQFSIALHYLNGKQADKAVKWFKKAASQGNVGAIYYYGYLKFNGMGTTQDKAGGIKYLELASKKGFPMADYQLGKIHLEGDGVEKDASKAFEYIRKAAFNGIVDAKWELGTMYQKGEGVAQDFFLSAQWMAEGAQTTHKKDFENLIKEDSDGVFSLYLKGLRQFYVDNNYDAAVNYFNKVDKAKDPEGKTMLGLCYANKDYSKQNEKKAFKTLAKAAENSKVAKYYLASLYESGIGVTKDDKTAVDLLKKAADDGIALAECELGDRYMTGNGVPTDFTKAAQLYLDAEAQNQLSPESARKLVECYKKKLSILPDLADAVKRIEKLDNQKANTNLMNLLKLIEK